MPTICDTIKKALIEEYEDDHSLPVYLRQKIEIFKDRGSFDDAIVSLDPCEGCMLGFEFCDDSQIRIKFNDQPEDFMEIIEFIERMIECDSL